MSEYVDADFGKSIDEFKTTTTGDYIKREDVYSALNVFFFTGIKKDIDAIPAADVEPVRHGHWIDEPTGQMCSECCEQFFDDGEYRLVNYHTRYCPNCGARMDGEEHD